MSNYVLILKNERSGSYKRVAFWVAAIDLMFFIYYGFYTKQGNERMVWVLLALLIPVVYFIKSGLNKSHPGKKNSSILYGYILLLWIPVSIWAALLHSILLVLDVLATQKLKIIVNEDGVHYPSFPKKRIQWGELDNVILKDGLITIDFKNNRLLQSETDASLIHPDETAFNLFCKQQLKTTSLDQ